MTAIDKIGDIAERFGELTRFTKRLLPGRVNRWLYKKSQPFIEYAEKRQQERIGEQTLQAMTDAFKEWHKEHWPELSDEEALKRYDGVTFEELEARLTRKN